jgi:hypothetical protein
MFSSLPPKKKKKVGEVEEEYKSYVVLRDLIYLFVAFVVTPGRRARDRFRE